jgi:hypothetical protein
MLESSWTILANKKVKACPMPNLRLIPYYPMPEKKVNVCTVQIGFLI